MSDPTTHALVRDVVLEAPSSPATASREHPQWKILSKNGAFPVAADRCDIWPGNTRDVAALGSPGFLDLIDSIRSVGQKMPVVARISTFDPSRLEIVAGACRLTAIRQINQKREPDDRIAIIVDLRDLDDEAALKVVDAENRGRSDMSPIEKARFYQQAIDRVYLTELALSEALGLNKSTVNRTLAILKLPSDLFAIIKDPHRISAAQASGFISDWSKPELAKTLETAIKELVATDAATAATVFKVLKAAVAPPSPPGTVAIVHEDAEVGSIRQHKSGRVIIELAAEARALGWKQVAQATGIALRQLAKPSEQ